MISWSLILFSSIVLNLKIGLVWYKIRKCIRYELKKKIIIIINIHSIKINNNNNITQF